jgi:glycerol uptake facilitator-like aquaporin
MMVAPQMLLTNGLANDGQGFRSPFAGRFQVIANIPNPIRTPINFHYFQIFLIELLGSTLLVLAFIFPALLIPRPKLFSVAFSSASARSVASSLGSRSPLGQCANLARALANSLLAAIFTRAEEFAIWRLFHLHLFAAISSPIVAAAIFWLILKRGEKRKEENEGILT